METAKGKTREETINRLADRIDSFERYTQPHSRLMAELATRLARRFGLARPDVDAISEAAMLHDIGLLAMSPAPTYLSLPRPLSFEARLDLWRHPVIGEQHMSKREAPRHAQLLVRWHHEWWNGSGYPDMLSFEDIPIGARILRAVELYCSLLCDRPYRAALDQHEALDALSSSAGIECDPYVVKALLALLDEMREPAQDPEAVQITQPSESEIQAPPAAEPSLFESPIAQSSPVPAPPGTEPLLPPSSDVIPAQPLASPERNNIQSLRAYGEVDAGWQAMTAETTDLSAPSEPIPTGVQPVETLSVAQPADGEARHTLPSVELLLSRAQRTDLGDGDATRWRGWQAPRYNKKALLGFQASVLRQIEFRSIAIPNWSEARLDLYLKAWGKLIFANDPRAWAATLARATVEAAEALSEDVVARVLEDVYVPGVRLANPDLRRWFGETDAWWMDNLRRNIDALNDQNMSAQALVLGLHTGDYALSFDEETRELRRPLTTVFWRLAGRAFTGPAGHPHNRSFSQPVEDFIKQARADVLFLSLPSAHTDRGGAEARSDWREAWVKGSPGDAADDAMKPSAPPQSRQSYLASIDRLLRSASHFRTWAVEYQEPGLALAQDIIELIKEYRPVRATYSKDVTEVAGGLRSYIIVGERSSPR